MCDMGTTLRWPSYMFSTDECLMSVFHVRVCGSHGSWGQTACQWHLIPLRYTTLLPPDSQIHGTTLKPQSDSENSFFVLMYVQGLDYVDLLLVCVRETGGLWGGEKRREGGRERERKSRYQNTREQPWVFPQALSTLLQRLQVLSH